jgi:hypothetical protein
VRFDLLTIGLRHGECLFQCWPAICASVIGSHEQHQIYQMQSQNENNRLKKIRSSLPNAIGMMLVAVFVALWGWFLFRAALYLIKHLIRHT